MVLRYWTLQVLCAAITVSLCDSGSLSESKVPSIPACEPEVGTELPGASLLQNGSLAFHGTVFPRGTFWRGENRTFFGCPCAVTTCLRICDVEEEENSDNDKNIIQSEHPFGIEPFNLTIWREEEEKSVGVHDHFFAFRSKMCPDTHTAILIDLESDQDMAYQILHNGSLFYTNLTEIHGPHHFCLAQLNPSLPTRDVVVCNLSMEPLKPEPAHSIYPWFMFVSVFFLGLTLLAYGLDPSMRNLHGRCQAAHAASLLVGFFCLALIQILALITHPGLLSSFFWVNVSSFDIWRGFSGFRTMRTSTGSAVTRRFLKYCCYAYGVPLAIFLLAVTMQYAPGAPDALNPNIGKTICWFDSGNGSDYIYFYGPILIVLVLNIFFFASTALKIVQVRRETAMLQRGESRTHCRAEQKRFVLYLKLFLVMGLTWPMEVVSKMVGGESHWWYFTDIINILQGVSVFLVCVWFAPARDPLLRALLPPEMAARLARRPEMITSETHVSMMSSASDQPEKNHSTHM